MCTVIQAAPCLRGPPWLENEIVAHDQMAIVQAQTLNHLLNVDNSPLLHYNPNPHLHLANPSFPGMIDTEFQLDEGPETGRQEASRLNPAPRVVQMRCKRLVRFGLRGQFCAREGY